MCSANPTFTFGFFKTENWHSGHDRSRKTLTPIGFFFYTSFHLRVLQTGERAVPVLKLISTAVQFGQALKLSACSVTMSDQLTVDGFMAAVRNIIDTVQRFYVCSKTELTLVGHKLYLILSK